MQKTWHQYEDTQHVVHPEIEHIAIPKLQSCSYICSVHLFCFHVLNVSFGRNFLNLFLEINTDFHQLTLEQLGFPKKILTIPLTVNTENQVG